MHVLQLAWEYPPRLFGGLGRHVHGLVRALAAGGTRVTVVTPHLRPSDGPEDPTSPDLRVIRAAAPAVALPPDQWVGGVLEADAAMVEAVLTDPVLVGAGRPDVLHAHDWMAGPAAMVLARLLDRPMVLTIHATERGRHSGHLPPGVSGWIDAQERSLVQGADQVIVCADGMVPAARGLGASAVQVIGGGIDAAPWSMPSDRRHNRIVCAGRLEFEKGVHVLLAATHDLDVEVVVAGAGTYAGALRDQAHVGVRFVGHLQQPALAALLGSATIAVVPSIYEPFGLAAREAMATGTPVILSRTGGMQSLAEAGLAVGVPPDDVMALRVAITALLEDPPARRDLSRRGRDHVRGLGWAPSALRHAEAYDRLSGGGLAQRPASRDQQQLNGDEANRGETQGDQCAGEGGRPVQGSL